jgi:hypothetical protein
MCLGILGVIPHYSFQERERNMNEKKKKPVMQKNYTQIETEIKICYTTTLGDSGDFTGFSKKDIDEMVQAHIKDYADEYNIDEHNIKIMKVTKS